MLPETSPDRVVGQLSPVWFSIARVQGSCRMVLTVSPGFLWNMMVQSLLLWPGEGTRKCTVWRRLFMELQLCQNSRSSCHPPRPMHDRWEMGQGRIWEARLGAGEPTSLQPPLKVAKRRLKDAYGHQGLLGPSGSQS